MTWTIIGVVGGMIALQSTFLLYIISGLKSDMKDLKSDMNRQFDAVNARLDRHENNAHH